MNRLLKRFVTLLMTTVIVLAADFNKVYACDHSLSEAYISNIIFGDNTALSESNEAQLLMKAIYLCCEQTDEQGSEELSFLKQSKVWGLPSINRLSIKYDDLLETTHKGWGEVGGTYSKAWTVRQNTLRSTVNKVFDFGMLNNMFGKKSGKCDSFAALLFYSHILADYLSGNPSDTEILVNDKMVPAFSGRPYVELNGNSPEFKENIKKMTDNFMANSSLDSLGRCGTAFAILHRDTMGESYRKNTKDIIPTGWNQKEYEGLVSNKALYNKCHIIAHKLGGDEDALNMFTGTRYLNNDGMEHLEQEISKYLSETGNHVVYRVTPIFRDENKVASGVHIEAYSVEDGGKGICCNRYYYNVQPGVKIDYESGNSEISDVLHNATGVIPFVTNNPSDANPDLTYEIKKHLGVLFDDTNNKESFSSLIYELDSIANEARNLNCNSATTEYIRLKELEFKYYEALACYVPGLLQKQDFFKKTFYK